MKILQSIQKQLSILGFDFSQLVQKTHRFGAKSVSIILMLSLGVALNAGYVFHVAKQFHQFVDSIYSTSALLCTTICFTAGVFRISILSEYIARLGKIVNQSELLLLIFLTLIMNRVHLNNVF